MTNRYYSKVMKGLTNVLLWTVLVGCCHRGIKLCEADDSYKNMTALLDNLLGPGSGYNTKLRPVNYQSDLTTVNVIFSVVSLEHIDDVKQSITINGFLSLDWTDQRMTWDHTLFNGMPYLNLNPNDVWRPRMVLLNTLGDRDVFKDNYSPLIAYYSGYMWWMPGGIFKGSCGLDMRKYPFDEQTCRLTFCPMGYPIEHLVFKAKEESFHFQMFVSNKEWDIPETQVVINNSFSLEYGVTLSCIDLIITVRRRSSYYVLNLILPVLLLSFLNNFVFLIPDESGEKIGYGITVLLSMSVFLTTVSTMIPRDSNNIPTVTVYLFVLLLFSVLSVVASIATVYLHHNDEGETEDLKAHHRYTKAVKKVFGLRKAVRKIDPRHSQGKMDPRHNDATSSSSSSPVLNFDDGSCLNNAAGSSSRNKYRTITKHINKICFVSSLSFWVITQAAYFVYVKA